MATPASPPAQLTHGPVRKHLFSLAIPMLLGVLAIMMVGIVDTLFVSQLGVKQLAAISFTFPVISLGMNLTMGLGIGVTASISRAIGQEEGDRVRALATHALIFGLLCAVLGMCFGLWVQERVFLSLGASPELIPMLKSYMNYWFVGLIFFIVPMLGNGVLRASGDTKSPMLMMLGGAVINAMLDPLLIFGWGPFPRLELEGAAIATLISRLCIFIFAMYLLAVKHKFIDWGLPRLSAVWASWRAIFSVGIPAALTNALIPVATGVVTAMIALHGKHAIAAYGLGSRLEGLFLLVPLVLGGALSPFIGQNMGANLNGRMWEGIRFAQKVSLVWGFGAWLFVELAAGWMAPLMSRDPLVQQTFVLYLRIISAGYFVHGLVSVTSATFNAMDHAVRSTIISASQNLLLAIPLAWLGNRWAGFPGLLVGLVLAKYTTAIWAALWVSRYFSKESRCLAATSIEIKKKLYAFEQEQPALATKIEQMVAQIAALDEVYVGLSRDDAFSFFVEERELAHLHDGGILDLAVPPGLRDVLVKEGKVTHHRYHHDGAWVSHDLQTAEDIEVSIWLLRLVHLFYEWGSHGEEDPSVQTLFEGLSMSAEVERVLRGCVAVQDEPMSVAA